MSITSKSHRPYSLLAVLLTLCLIIGSTGSFSSQTSLAIVSTTVLLLIASYYLRPFFNRLSIRQIRTITYLALTLMVIGQVLILIFLPVSVYHDPYRVLSQADQLAAGDHVWQSTYFWRYPNNVPITYILSKFFALGQLVHLSNNITIHLLTLGLLDTFIVLVLKTCADLKSPQSTFLGLLAFLTATPFAYTYYLQVFYSDLPAMLAVLVIFRLLWRWPKANTTRAKVKISLGLTATALLGMLMKPNMIVLLPAGFLTLLILAIKKERTKKQLLLPIICLSLGMALAMPGTLLIDHASSYQPHSAEAFPASHWILMGLNKSGDGMYDDQDVEKDISLGDSSARRQYDSQQIVHRIQTLGPLGLSELWLKKLTILLDVSAVQDWYNGGFESAPKWYQDHIAFYQKAIKIGYVVASIILFFTVSLRLLCWRPRFHRQKDQLALLAVLTALGYLAFHVIFWEAESRYGQSILPALFVLLVALPAPVVRRQKVTKVKRQKHWPRVAFLISATIAIYAVFLQSYSLSTIVVAAQRSQLSVQYHAQPTTINPGTTLEQQVNLAKPANTFLVQIQAKSTMTVTLQNLQSGQVWALTEKADEFILNQPLPAGSYQIVIQNQGLVPQLIDLVQTNNYTLAPFPVTINQVQNKNASLIYLFEWLNTKSS
ncbi:PMT family glycosyltransferase ArnT/Agl22 [Fructobacillus evanidus]|uniref:Involved in glycosylation of proteins and lipid IVA (ArnT) n=1 Tax=Fructobacillus evanidus TaxID=3064281 RepID=A0ABM9MYZ9_9LACO|nr:PMT family glycosyltransferase ArnT/Agl22 [Fructobacillus sp. LMG 32999]CAK1242911.1 PMT family glycosyltransferase ArnT/Agl22 [Fructobacillus sp. LMG 32999]CAK1249072.1 PMT family glycosyltransferase ArnT/Agl22 [Fructobacillus sp. LMG 32999]CAK1249800.1 PMT family glycosyltransferase ArnT/Agl22 [Fructobacillus sp. LMG 32999]CAK1249812.1 PMT family glycosyltransferase ArnT/Agl22 [Fructobacillus sp. LMG 32999]